MKDHILLFGLIFGIISLTAGCNTLQEINNNPKVDPMEETITQNESKEIAILQTKIEELETENNELLMKGRFTSEVIDEWYAEFDQKYPLLRAGEWDKIVISQPWNDHEVTITDPKVIRAFETNFGGFREVEGLGSGPHSDIPHYAYTFFKDDQKQTIEVVERGMIKVNDEYYYTDKYVHLLGNAFYPAPSYISYDIPVITKIAQSSYLYSEHHYQVGMFDSFRIIGSIWPLAEEGKLISIAPDETSELLQTLQFYFYGEKITVNVFEEQHIQIVTEDEKYWYKMEEPTQVGRIISAG